MNGGGGIYAAPAATHPFANAGEISFNSAGRTGDKEA